MQKNIFLFFFCCLASRSVLGSQVQADRGSPGANRPVAFFQDTTVHRDTLTRTREGSEIRWLNDSTAYELLYARGSCKQLVFYVRPKRIQFRTPDTEKTPKHQIQPLPVREIAANRKPIHGDILYDYSQHASPDTSFPGSSYVQHHVIANVHAILLDKYPVVFHAGTLQTDIPYIKNYVDLSVAFDRKVYGSSMLNHLQDQVRQDGAQAERRDSLQYADLVNGFQHQQSLSGWLNSDKQVQQLIGSNNVLQQYEATPKMPSQPPGDSSITHALSEIEQIKSQLHTPSLEKALTVPAASKDSTADSVSGEKLQKAIRFIKEYSEKLAALQKGGKAQDSLEQQYDSAHSQLKSHRDSLEKMLNAGDLAQLEKQYPDSNKEMRSYRLWMGIRQLSLGRSSVNYTPLSAQNISLTGINAEYCNHYYFALAAGKVDFRYLDFLTASSTPNQYLFLGRAGIGEKEGRHLYFTVYTGSKQASYTNLNNTPATEKLTGITMEAKFPVDRNTYLTGEIAKSSYPSFVATGTSPGKLTNFSDRNNEAYSIQLYSYWPSTDTRVFGAYSKMGVYFQSFNIFSNNSNAASWQVRVDQYLWRKRLAITASVKKNDFTSPFVVNNYKSQTVFYSLQASLRLRKWPVFTVGFLPYSQLTNINGQFEENRFYTLMGSSNYAYRVHSLFMSSSLVYTRYFNSSNQVGFPFYNAQSWFYNHSVILKQFTLNGSLTITTSPGYYLLSAGPGVQWRVSKLLSMGGGIKYNDLNNINKPFGYNGNIDYQVGHMGRIALSYERGYLPGQNNNLFRNDWGRATYTKNF